MRTFGVMRLQDELSRWGALGEKPVFWIRDDDAIKITQPLERLQLIAARHDTTIGLAVIPALLESDLATFLRFERNNFYPMCHGWKHINFGEDGNPNEFGTSRPFRSAFIDATSALQTFRGRFPDIPAVFVPPFNRIAPEISDSLSDIGFVGLSAAPRPIERRVARLITRFGWLRGFDIASKGRLRRIDTQVDLIDWQSASANDLAEVCDMLLGQLRLRRNGFLPLGTPIGLLIHHLVHNEHIWNLFERMILLIKDDLGCEFADVGRMFSPAAPASTAEAIID